MNQSFFILQEAFEPRAALDDRYLNMWKWSYIFDYIAQNPRNVFLPARFKSKYY